MKKINSFYVIGTVGMIATAVLHIFLSRIIVDPSLNSAFFVLYPSSLAFLAIGTGQLLQAKKIS